MLHEKVSDPGKINYTRLLKFNLKKEKLKKLVKEDIGALSWIKLSEPLVKQTHIFYAAIVRTKSSLRSDFIDWMLEDEWNKTNGRLIILYGRRRIGKTRLITEFTSKKNGTFYFAEDTSSHIQINRLQEKITEFTHPALRTSP